MWVGSTDPESVTFNVSGHQFCCTRATLLKHPDTRLYRLAVAAGGQNGGQEYFFDGDEQVFREVIRFYRTGRLHVPPNMVYESFVDQLAFWDIGEHSLASCCGAENEENMEKEFKWLEARIAPEDPESNRTWRASMWNFLTDPFGPHTKYATASKAWMVTYLILNLINVIMFASVTLPSRLYTIFGTRSMVEAMHMTSHDQCWAAKKYALNLPTLMEWRVAIVCNFIFVSEMIIKIVVCPCKKKFFRSAHLLDFLLTAEEFTTSVMLCILDYQWAAMLESVTVCKIVRALVLAMIATSSGRMVKFIVVATNLRLVATSSPRHRYIIATSSLRHRCNCCHG